MEPSQGLSERSWSRLEASWSALGAVLKPLGALLESYLAYLSDLGELLKKDVRKIAEENSLVNASKKDSTGICFIGDRKYNDFVGQFLKEKKGKIITVDGEIIGEHNGHMYFTVGQRKGLGIGARNSANDKPWYVVNKDITKNVVYIACLLYTSPSPRD